MRNRGEGGGFGRKNAGSRLCSCRLGASSKEEERGRGEKHPGTQMDKGDVRRARFAGGHVAWRSPALCRSPVWEPGRAQ